MQRHNSNLGVQTALNQNRTRNTVGGIDSRLDLDNSAFRDMQMYHKAAIAVVDFRRTSHTTKVGRSLAGSGILRGYYTERMVAAGKVKMQGQKKRKNRRKCSLGDSSNWNSRYERMMVEMGKKVDEIQHPILEEAKVLVTMGQETKMGSRYLRRWELEMQMSLYRTRNVREEVPAVEQKNQAR
jgi:hypothetical protein